jgi:hypothetical protein
MYHQLRGRSLSYVILRGRWCDIIVLNVHAPTEDKCDDTKDSFYEELEGVFDQFFKHQMQILLVNFNAMIGRDCIFKSTIGNKILHHISNDNEIRVINFATLKSLVVNSAIFHIAKFINTLGFMMERHTVRLVTSW